jgi:hypothetical protein
MKIALSIFMVCLFAGLAHPSDELLSSSGEAFTRDCSAVDKKNKNNAELVSSAMCTAYVEGYRAGAMMAVTYAEAQTGKTLSGPFCIPKGVEDGQINQDHIELHRSASGRVSRFNFHCRGWSIIEGIPMSLRFRPMTPVDAEDELIGIVIPLEDAVAFLTVLRRALIRDGS